MAGGVGGLETSSQLTRQVASEKGGLKTMPFIIGLNSDLVSA